MAKIVGITITSCHGGVRSWPDYAVHAETTVEPVVGKAAYSVSLIDGALTIHRNGDPVLATAIPVDWQRPAVLEMVAQGHRADGAAERQRSPGAMLLSVFPASAAR